MSDVRTAKIAARQWGLSPEQLAERPTSFRDDLLAGQVVVVSGASSGIGRATLYLMARLGAQVQVCARDAEKMKRTVDELYALTGA